MGRVGGNGYKILEGEVGCFRQSGSDIVEYCTSITMRTTTSQETLTTPRCDFNVAIFILLPASPKLTRDSQVLK